MLAQIQKWGNSQGVRFPKTILAEAAIEVGDKVRMTVEDGKIIIEPDTVHYNHYDIHELVARMPADYQVEEVDWGAPTGKEIW